MIRLRPLPALLLCMILPLAGCTWHDARPLPLMRTVLRDRPAAAPPGSPAFEAEMDRLTRTCAIPGNRVRVLENGDEVFPAKLAAIAEARERISLEIYDWTPDEIGTAFADALIEARQRGVEVRFLYDRVGSNKVDRASVQRLLDAGIEVRVFNPKKAWTVVRLNNRNHRKNLIVDGRIAFVGGLNIADHYTGDGINGWRDTAAEVRGPAAHAVECVFADTWNQGGTDFLGRDLPLVGMRWLKRGIDKPFMAILGREPFVPPPPSAIPETGGTAVRVIPQIPDTVDAYILNMYLLAINSAEKNIYLSTAYFLPPEILTRALCEAADRGVDVRIITQGATDHPIVRNLSHGYFARLIRRGVRVYEWPHKLMHAKTIVVDGTWFSVGSCNLDGRALLLNYETNIAAVDPAVAARMERQFHRDLQETREFTLEDEAARPFRHRLFQTILVPFRGQF